MSGWNVVSNCPSCGAPIYIPGVWSGITPPPPSFTCTCKTYQLHKNYEINTPKNIKCLPAHTNIAIENDKESLEKEIEQLKKEIEELKFLVKELTENKQNKFLKKNKKILKD